jgi:hypothetical protein
VTLSESVGVAPHRATTRLKFNGPRAFFHCSANAEARYSRVCSAAVVPISSKDGHSVLSDHRRACAGGRTGRACARADADTGGRGRGTEDGRTREGRRGCFIGWAWNSARERARAWECVGVRRTARAGAACAGCSGQAPPGRVKPRPRPRRPITAHYLRAVALAQA